MDLRCNVTFKVSIPFNLEIHPVGWEVSEYLSRSVESNTGLRSSIDDWRDAGYELDFVINEKAVHFAFVYVADSPFHFYGQISSYVGWLRRLLGYRDDDEIELLILAFHQTLSNDSAFSDVYWHEAFYEEAQKSIRP